MVTKVIGWVRFKFWKLFVITIPTLRVELKCSWKKRFGWKQTAIPKGLLEREYTIKPINPKNYEYPPKNVVFNR